MRTEEDLHAALTSLEQHAPAAARVLPGNSRPVSRRLRSPQATRWLAGIATTAALAGAITAVTLPGGSTSPAPTAEATLQAKILAAISANGNEIMYMHSTYTLNYRDPHTNPNPATQNMWYYPAEPRTGQQVRVRIFNFQGGGGQHDDLGLSYRQPPPHPALLPGRRTRPVHGKVHKIQPSHLEGSQIYVNYNTKTFSDVKKADVGQVGPPSVTRYLKSKQWTARNTTLNGRPTLELTLYVPVLQGKTVVNSWREHLWVDASTYLPLHEALTFGPPGQSEHEVADYSYLPATPANLAKLSPPIPAGFKQVTPAQVAIQP